MEKRTRERDIIPWAMYFMVEFGADTTAEIKNCLLKHMPLYDGDLVKSNSRPDNKFTEIVRNLKSHNTLEKKGLATYNNGYYQPTNKGIEYAKQYDFSSLFNITPSENSDEEEIIISEGQKIEKIVTVTKRSETLKKNNAERPKISVRCL